MQGTSRSELAAELGRCALLCDETATVCAERDDARPELVTALLLAAAGLETALHAVEAASTAAETALLIAATLARDAVDAAERHGLDPSLLQCVAACRRVIELCE